MITFAEWSNSVFPANVTAHTTFWFVVYHTNLAPTGAVATILCAVCGWRDDDGTWTAMNSLGYEAEQKQPRVAL